MQYKPRYGYGPEEVFFGNPIAALRALSAAGKNKNADTGGGDTGGAPSDSSMPYESGGSGNPSVVGGIAADALGPAVTGAAPGMLDQFGDYVSGAMPSMDFGWPDISFDSGMLGAGAGSFVGGAAGAPFGLSQLGQSIGAGIGGYTGGYTPGKAIGTGLGNLAGLALAPTPFSLPAMGLGYVGGLIGEALDPDMHAKTEEAHEARSRASEKAAGTTDAYDDGENVNPMAKALGLGTSFGQGWSMDNTDPAMPISLDPQFSQWSNQFGKYSADAYSPLSIAQLSAMAPPQQQSYANPWTTEQELANPVNDPLSDMGHEGGAGVAGGADSNFGMESNDPGESGSEASVSGGAGGSGGSSGGSGSSGGDSSGGSGDGSSGDGSGGGSADSDGSGDADGLAAGGFVEARHLGGKNPKGPDDGKGNLDIGEYVIRKAVAEKLGADTLDKINSGNFDKRALIAAVNAMKRKK